MIATGAAGRAALLGLSSPSSLQGSRDESGRARLRLCSPHPARRRAGDLCTPASLISWRLPAAKTLLITYAVPQSDNITTLIKAANVKVEPYWPSLFAKLFETRSIGDLITNVGAGDLAQPAVVLRAWPGVRS